MSNNTEWLKSLKVGDKVAVSDRGYEYTTARVKKITATQIVTEYVQYRRKDGVEIGATGYHCSRLCQLTDEIRYSIKRRSLINNLSNVLKDLSYEQIDRIEQVIGEAKR